MDQLIVIILGTGVLLVLVAFATSRKIKKLFRDENEDKDLMALLSMSTTMLKIAGIILIGIGMVFKIQLLINYR